MAFIWDNVPESVKNAQLVDYSKRHLKTCYFNLLTSN